MLLLPRRARKQTPRGIGQLPEQTHRNTNHIGDDKSSDWSRADREDRSCGGLSNARQVIWINDRTTVGEAFLFRMPLGEGKTADKSMLILLAWEPRRLLRRSRSAARPSIERWKAETARPASVSGGPREGKDFPKRVAVAAATPCSRCHLSFVPRPGRGHSVSNQFREAWRGPQSANALRDIFCNQPPEF